MTAAHVTLGGEPVSTVRLTLPERGVWWADVELELAPALSGRVELRIGDRSWSGTIDPQRSGTHMERARVRLVGGAGSWGTSLRAKHYHSDAGVRAQLVLEDAAREAGEAITIPASIGTASLGADYVRKAGPASRALEDALRASGATWWVDADGVTQLASARVTSDADPAAYEVLDVNPRARVVTLACDDVTAVGVGSRLTTRLDAPLTVRELDVCVEVAAVRLMARCSPASDSVSSLLRTHIERVTGEKIWGLWRFRVTQRTGDRVELQPVRAAAGLPDILPVSMWPGVAGSHAEVALGAEVLVEFIEGDRTMPIVRAFAGKDGVGHTPETHTLSVSSELRLGGPDAFKSPATAEAVLVELLKIQATLETGANSGGDVIFGTPYVAPSDVSDIGVPKTRVS